MSGDPASCNDAAETTDGICAATETDQKYSVAWSPKPDEGGVAVDHVARDSEACCLCDGVVDPAQQPAEQMTAVPLRA